VGSLCWTFVNTSFEFLTNARPHTHSTEYSFICKSLCGAPPSLLSSGYHLTSHLHIVQRLRMHGTISPLPHTSSWCGA